MAKRIKRAGMKLLVDFHYSDRWTDPGKQWQPAAWKDLDAAGLTAKVAEHTTSVLTALHRAGVTADYVQIGNEINPGMLWPLGQTWDVEPATASTTPQWDNLAAFLTAGAQAAKAVTRRTKTLLHLTNVNNGIGSLTWWFDDVVARDVPFDLIGLSFYGYWHGSFADLQTAISVLSDRYDRHVLVVETAYPWTLGQPDVPWRTSSTRNPSWSPATRRPRPARPPTCARSGRRRGAPGGRGLGIVWWEPAWTAVPGNGWDPDRPGLGQRLGEPGGVRLERPRPAGAGHLRPGLLSAWGGPRPVQSHRVTENRVPGPARNCSPESLDGDLLLRPRQSQRVRENRRASSDTSASKPSSRRALAFDDPRPTVIIDTMGAPANGRASQAGTFRGGLAPTSLAR